MGDSIDNLFELQGLSIANSFELQTWPIAKQFDEHKVLVKTTILRDESHLFI